jgi:hypothetical protein
MGGFSLGLVFFLLLLPGLGLWTACIYMWRQQGMILGGAVMGLYFLVLSVMSAAVQGIFNTALYRYACDQAVPAGFSRELIEQAWSPKD